MEDIIEFTQQNCNRKLWIMQKLASFGIEGIPIQTGSLCHILVKYKAEFYDPTFRQKTVLVHYDRVPNTPGANDNSAAVLQVLDWANRLSFLRQAHNVRIFFTDGEEAKGGVKTQGSFALASLYKKLSPKLDDIFVFDCCGRGDVPIIASPTLDKKHSQFNKSVMQLHERTVALLKEVSPQKWLTLPVPYSDNAGFIACGIPAVAITMLPQEEASLYMQSLSYKPNLIDEVLHKKRHDKEAVSFLPLSWRFIHTELDSPHSLTSISSQIMAKILDSLASQRVLS